MLLPALNKAQMKAKVTGCLNILKQIGYAHSQYSADYNGYFIPARTPSITYAGISGIRDWPSMLGKYDSYSPCDYGLLLRTSVLSYPIYCPAVNNMTGLGNSTYILNAWLHGYYDGGSWAKPARLTGTIRNPSRAISTLDSCISSSLVIYPYNNVIALDGSLYCPGIRHGADFNLSYADGHVKNKKLAFLNDGSYGQNMLQKGINSGAAIDQCAD